MPVLPEYASGAFQEGVGNVAGLMSLSERAERRALLAEETQYRRWEREVRKPVVAAQAQAQLSDYAARLNTQKFEAEQATLAARDIVEAQEQLKGFMADPKAASREQLFDWLEAFGSYADIPGPHQKQFALMANEVKTATEAKLGRMRADETFDTARSHAAIKEREDAERLATLHEKAMKRAGGEEFGVPFKLRGTEQWVMWDERTGMTKVEVNRNDRVESFAGGPEISADGQFQRSSAVDEWKPRTPAKPGTAETFAQGPEVSSDGRFFRSSTTDAWKPIKAEAGDEMSPELQRQIDTSRATVASLTEETALAEAAHMANPSDGTWFTSGSAARLRQKQTELAAAKLRLQSLTSGAESAFSDGASTSPEGSPAGTPASGAPGAGSANAEPPAGAGRAGPGKRAGIGAAIGTAVWPGVGTVAGAIIGAATAPNEAAPAASAPGATVTAAPPPGSISPEEAAKLPKGTKFLGHDGRYRIR